MTFVTAVANRVKNLQADMAMLASSQDVAADEVGPCHTVQIDKPIQSAQKVRVKANVVFPIAVLTSSSLPKLVR